MRTSLRRISRAAVLSTVLTVFIGLTAPSAVAGAEVDRFEGLFETVVPVAFADNPAGVELMFAECDFVHRVVRPDGSAMETESCHLTDPFFVFPGTAPSSAFNISGGACVWFSDYFTQTSGEDVFADSIRITVTPSGRVNITSTYPAEPIPLSDC